MTIEVRPDNNSPSAFVHRRISSTFREILGGHILGPSRDYSFRLLDPELFTGQPWLD
jgi:alpha-D-ribose 1-methylphosphonate 5-triphosphate synthase subunit PhnI